MKTKIPAQIDTLQQACQFLKELYDNGESYHCDDPAADIEDDNGRLFTDDEAALLDKTMDRLRELCDPCEILLWFDPPFAGKEYVNNVPIEWSGYKFPEESPFEFVRVNEDDRWVLTPLNETDRGFFSQIIVEKTFFQPTVFAH
jgi:hypothetical protein